MLKTLPGALLCLLLVSAPVTLRAQSSETPRVTALYTTWDDYYLYVGGQVHDPKVNSTNTLPTSQPQQDDDLEVFVETDNARASVRTPQTYQMAVSAGNGAYFSVGNGTKVPAAKAVYTYKYAAGVDGTLNSNSDTDTGYTVEIAIPWQELGLKNAPRTGTVWGFNVVSRDRDSTASPAARFYSLSPNVTRAADVQTPAKWTRMVFENGGDNTVTDAGGIACPHVALDRFPLINGSIVAGEWASSARTAFGTNAIDAPAPTVAEEPNTNASPFDNPPPAPDVTAQNPPPAPAPDVPPAPEVLAPGTAIGSISLPGGGSIKIVPGGITPPPFKPQPQVASIPQDAGTGINGRRVNPLTPKYPKNYKPAANAVDLTGSLRLTDAQPTKLVLGVYRLDFNADGRKAPQQNVWNSQGATLLVDQPLNGAGPWFTGLRPQWHRQQLSDLRRAGVDVALLRCRADDPLLSRELDALVEALKELKAANQDYPLIGLEQRAGAGSASADTVFAHIPSEFRAQATPGGGGSKAGVLVATSPGGSLAFGALADATPVTAITEDLVVSPGRVDTAVIARNGGETYAAGWAAAIATKAQYVVIDSWNDFAHATEVCASRQYSEKYADDTRLLTNAFHGDKQWHALYLAEQCPRTIRPRTLYQIPIRITNAGTLPWRAGEGYSLCPRWYKDGRLYDDSAPRIPVGTDVLPGQSVTLSVGLAAQNQYGDDLDPGQYVLVFDMVQGQDRWFSYASDSPLQIPVTVVPYAKDLPAQATFIGSTTPTTLATRAPYPTAITVRNDGSANWNNDLIAYKVQTVDPDTGDVRTITESAGETLPTPILPGEAVTVNVTATVATKGAYRLHWFVKSPKAGADPIAGAYDEAVTAVLTDPAVNFVLSDIPRTANAGTDFTARLALQNLGPQTWRKGSRKVGYHWYYLDGTEAEWDTNTTATLTKDVAPGRADGDLAFKVHMPDTPGRYALVFDVQDQSGTWASTLPAARANDTLQVIETVTKGSVTPVDLRKYADATGITSDPITTGTGGFDGKGRTFPADTLPPDATTEVDGNPLLIGPATAPLYPSGYYASNASSNHRISFLYPLADTANIVTCHGQTINLPAGEYRVVHLLMAAAGGGQSAVGAFTVGANPAQSITIASWDEDKGATNPVAFRSPYRLGPGGPDPAPALLRDYALPVTGRINAITLPGNPAIKIVAVSLEK